MRLEHRTTMAADALRPDRASLAKPPHELHGCGCFRIGNVKSVEGKFSADGQHYGFMTFATFDESGLKDIQSHNLLKNGVYSETVATSKTVQDAIRKAVATWASVPANIALIVRNEIKDQKKSIQHVERQIASYEQQLAKA